MNLIEDGIAEVPERISGIYFLCQNGEVQYVGQSVNIIVRVSQHRSNKAMLFDSAFYIPFPAENLDHFEMKYIIKYNPPLNIQKGKYNTPHIQPDTPEWFELAEQLERSATKRKDWQL